MNKNQQRKRPAKAPEKSLETLEALAATWAENLHKVPASPSTSRYLRSLNKRVVKARAAAVREVAQRVSDALQFAAEQGPRRFAGEEPVGVFGGDPSYSRKEVL